MGCLTVRVTPHRVVFKGILATSSNGVGVTGYKQPFILICCTVFSLAGCNSTDALVPPLDIGMSSQSTPLTQQDLDRASSNADQYAQQHPRQRNTPQEVSSYQPVQPNYSSQNTLDAQAQALQQGTQRQQEQLSTRLYQQPAPGMEPQESQMLPTPIQSSEPDSTLDANQPQSQRAPVANEPVQVAARGEAGTIRFLPIIGAPMEAVKPLSQELGNSARTSGLTILPSSDRAADNILKGYLSAFEDGNNVNIVYVWDVLDSAGNRLHRLQGQQSAAKVGSDPWASANALLMQDIAKSTIQSYVEWKKDQGN